MVDELTRFLSSDAMNAEVVSGISIAFALIFFVPLWIVAGLVPLWLPVGVRWLFGVERGDST